MRIYFNASITGKSKYEHLYKKVEDTLADLNHYVVTPLFISSKEDIHNETRKETKTYTQNMLKWIKSADICVFEMSYPSTGIGFEIAKSLEYNKPVILLTTQKNLKTIFDEIDDEKVQLIEYEESSVAKVLKQAVGYAADQQDTRFNFFISPEYQRYMDWVSKHRKVPRAVFLRTLINEAMASEKDYVSDKR